MSIDRNIVALLANFTQEFQCGDVAGSNEVLLINRIQVGIPFEQISGAIPQDERVNARIGKICAQFMNQRRGKERIADSRQ